MTMWKRKRKLTKNRLGIDVGGVLTRKGGKADTFLFGPNYLNAPAVEGALEAVNELAKSPFAGNLWIISKCGHKVECRTRDWLKAHNVDLVIPEDHWFFCKKRHEKAPIAETLGLTHFIDDRLEVLSYMTTVKKRYLFQPEAEEVEPRKHVLPQVQIVENWRELLKNLIQEASRV